MARPKKSEAPDTSQAIELTAGAIERLTCRTDIKTQAFLRDVKAPGLRVRVTNTGAKSFVFEAKLNRQTFRRTIGDVRAWTIEQARAEARRLAVVLDNGQDPREIERQQQAEREAAKAAAAALAVTVGEAWQRYLEQRRPFWGELNYRDHLKMTQAGGEQRKRLPGIKTMPGPLAELMPLRLADLTAPVIEAWAAREAKTRPARVRLALRLLKAFLRWAATEPDLQGNADPTAASAKRAREVAGKAKPKNDYLQREQLPAWFTHVRQIQNPVIAAYLQCLLLTGARREELAELKWEDVNFQWRGMELKDKIEGRRAVPLTPYVAHLLAALPRRNEWVFSSTGSKSGRLTEPSIAHRQACAAAGLELTLHGLRRSFASLCEWLDIPGGISAQIQGHAPQGVREQNYIRRPLDLLRVHHEKIEAWILEQAGVQFDPKAEPGKLRAVSA
ncbi:tyrosine-type recombinase/integrase [Diaphorobacter sp.]|uniref:tyrosine-type recombinase/integrase n=1 Tax=Diaphorobacter sp. TaxID=1934310 RepID=UPI003D105CBA